MAGFFCSARCPCDLTLKACDFASSARDAGLTVVSGFHSPVEQDCLNLLLKGKQRIVLCPAREIGRWRIPLGLRSSVAEGRLEIRSEFKDERRVTADTAQRRNEYVAQIADQVPMVYATPAGKLEALAHRLLADGKPVLTFESPYNASLLDRGARFFEPQTLARNEPRQLEEVLEQ